MPKARQISVVTAQPAIPPEPPKPTEQVASVARKMTKDEILAKYFPKGQQAPIHPYAMELSSEDCIQKTSILPIMKEDVRELYSTFQRANPDSMSDKKDDQGFRLNKSGQRINEWPREYYWARHPREKFSDAPEAVQHKGWTICTPENSEEFVPTAFGEDGWIVAGHDLVLCFRDKEFGEKRRFADHAISRKQHESIYPKGEFMNSFSGLQRSHGVSSQDLSVRDVRVNQRQGAEGT